MSTVNVKATSDLHGTLPPVEEVGGCDLLLIAGDVCPATDHSLEYQYQWIREDFAEWLGEIDARAIVWVAGNHDFIMQEAGRRAADGQPEYREGLLELHPGRATYLQDGYCDVLGLRVFGTPWSLSPKIEGWAFDGSRHVDMWKVWQDCPDDADVCVSHGPPYLFGDLVGNKGPTSLGSSAMADRVFEVRPQLTVFGHNHEGYGRWDKSWGSLANVAYLTDTYEAGRHPVMEFELEVE